jgi:acetyltransferase-like isoleucine patch superfamily enzyme
MTTTTIPINALTPERRVPHDWYDGTVPGNVIIDPTAHLETSYSFLLYRSQADVGLRLGAGAAAYTGTMFDVGPRGRIRIGKCSMIKVGWLICDEGIDIGEHVLISWNTVLMDSYRTASDPLVRRRQLERIWRERIEPCDLSRPRPIVIGDDVWIGFDSIILPGVTVGRGAIIGCRSVVVEDVPAYTIVAGNPARVIRSIQPGEVHTGHGHG